VITVTQGNAADFRARLPELLAVYRSAFLDVHEPDPEVAAGERGAIMRTHAEREGLRLVTADDADGLAGFCYGYHGARGQWWHDVVANALGAARAEEWLGDCREVVELHVRPDAQGRGIGRQLLRAALNDVPEATATLSALDLPDSPARRLYAAEGFVTLLAPYEFPGTSVTYAVLGKRLRPSP
jgi:GNAT superfamily N-acetyltransferase